MIETWHFVFLAIAGLAGIGYFAAKRSATFRKYVPIFVWLARMFQAAASAWKLSKAYKDAADIMFKYTFLIETANLKDSSDEEKLAFSTFVIETYTIVAGNEDEEEARRLANAVFVLLKNHPDLLATIKSFENNKEIEVKKATLIAADFLGELVNIKDKLDRQFYEHMIVGLNKALLELKAGSANKETVSKVSSTLWRMFQILRVYNKKKSMENLTSEELINKLESTMNGLIKEYLT